MRILLIQPPYTIRHPGQRRCQPPLGLAYLAASLKKRHQVRLLDCIAEGFNIMENTGSGFMRYGLGFKEISRRISSWSPDFVGVSSLFTSQAQNARAICSLVKNVNNRIKTVIGGAHPSAEPENEMSDRNVDFVVLGEGEEALSRLIYSIEEGGQLADIDAIAYRDGAGVRVNAKKRFIHNLDSLDFPAWEMLPLETYWKINLAHGNQTKGAAFLPVITSRGCPNRCIFCSIHNLWGRNFRPRCAENVLSEIAHLRNDLGVREIIFEDDNLTLDRERAKKIFSGILERKIKITWSVPNGLFLNSVDEQLLELMKDSGCHSVSFGIESGDRRMLEGVIGKQVDLDKTATIVSYAKKIGLETSVFFVVGLPGETRRTLDNTFRFARAVAADHANFFFATPLPGTGLWEKAGFDKGLPNGMSYYDLRSERPIVSLCKFTTEELSRLVRKQDFLLKARLIISNPALFLRKVLRKLKEKVFPKVKGLN